MAVLTFGPNAEATLTAQCGTTTGAYEMLSCGFDEDGKHGYPTLSWTENVTGSGSLGMEIHVQYTGATDLPDSYLLIALDKTVVNQTGIAWTGIDLQVSNSSPLLAWDMTHQPIDTQGYFSLGAYTAQGLWWDGWLPDGGTAELWAAAALPTVWDAQDNYWEGHFYLEQIPKSVAEPGTLGLLGAGLLGLGFLRRRQAA